MERNYGLDICRIAAMCGILILHILGGGGVLRVLSPSDGKYWICWFVEICACCSVNLFAVLSGYLGIRSKKNDICRVMELIFIVLFYSLIITICFAIGNRTALEDVGIAKSLFPAVAGRFWYITCYIPLALLKPWLNHAVLSLNIKQHKMLCCSCIILFCFFPAVLRTDFFAFAGGYSFVWLAVCYVLGSYLGRIECRNSRFIKTKSVVTFVGATVCLLGGNYLIFCLTSSDIHYLFGYTSPVVLLMALAVFVLFRNMNVKKGGHLIAKLATVAFDVYIIHCHILVFDYILNDNFLWLLQMPALMIPFLILLCALVGYILLSMIGLVRKTIFQKCFDRIIRRISDKINHILYTGFI